MDKSSDNNPGDHAGEAASATFRPIRLIWLVLLTAGGTGITVAFISKDWCFTAFSSAVMATVLIALLNSILLRSVAKHFHWGRKLQLLVVAAIVAGFAWTFRIDEQQLFQCAFGTIPPQGVQSLKVDSCLKALNGDQTILLRFVADRQTLDELVKARDFVRDDEPIKIWMESENAWDALWEKCFSNFSTLGGEGWAKVSPMSQPVFYQWDNEEGLLESTRLLWDAETGKAYVLYTLG